MNTFANPAANNKPLQFDTSKGQPPMAIPGGSAPMQTAYNMFAGQQQQSAGAADTFLQQGSMSGVTGIGGGPGGTDVDQVTMMQQMQALLNTNPSILNFAIAQMPREIKYFPTCTLFPPPPDTPGPSTRERPPGCKTIFIGSLPEKTTEQVIQEVFTSCGAIQSIRLSKKNYCHLRFMSTEAVDLAISYSGYMLQIEGNTDLAHSKRIHVDFAEARDDLRDHESYQRAADRERRHRSRLEFEMCAAMQPPSPPPLSLYSDHECNKLLDRVKNNVCFSDDASKLVTWLERGEVNRRSANNIYSVIQAVYGHVRQLTVRKETLHMELETLKESVQKNLQSILVEFEQIEKVFSVARKQKAWDHFSKAQRKNIVAWYQHAKDVKTLEEKKILAEREEYEMDVSEDGEERRSQSPDQQTPPAKHGKQKQQQQQPPTSEQLLEASQQYSQGMRMRVVQEENDTLMCQLEAYKNEVAQLSADLEQTRRRKDLEIVGLRQVLKRGGQGSSSSNKAFLENMSGSSPLSITDHTARIVGIVSAFLHVHPQGAGIHYITSYLQSIVPGMQSRLLEELMEQLPSVFRLEETGVGASLDKKWMFVGFRDGGLAPPPESWNIAFSALGGRKTNGQAAKSHTIDLTEDIDVISDAPKTPPPQKKKKRKASSSASKPLEKSDAATGGNSSSTSSPKGLNVNVVKQREADDGSGSEDVGKDEEAAVVEGSAEKAADVADEDDGGCDVSDKEDE